MSTYYTLASKVMVRHSPWLVCQGFAGSRSLEATIGL